MPTTHSLRQRIAKWIDINRASRMHHHYVAISEHINVTGNDRVEQEFFSKKFREYHRKTLRLLHIRSFLYIIIYAGLAINLFKAIPFLSFLVAFVQLGSAIISTSLAIVLVYLLTLRINLHLELMNECLTHLIAIYHKNPRRNTPAVLRALQRTL